MKLVSDATLSVVSARKGLGAGRKVIDSIKDNLPQHPNFVRLDASEAKVVVQELETLNEVAGRLADEVRAFRDNQRLDRDAPPPRSACCKNCRYFEATLSAEAHVPAVYQAIVEEPGVCVLHPPLVGGRNDKGLVVSSAFPLVHPTRWCAQWALAEEDEASAS